MAGLPVGRGNIRVLGIESAVAQFFVVVGLRRRSYEVCQKKEWKKCRPHEWVAAALS